MKIINEQQFKELLDSKKPFMVDFFATWCGPCKMLAPILERVQEKVVDECEIVKVDVDECENLARNYGIMSVPTMIMFNNGVDQEKMSGLRSDAQIIDFIQSNIN